MKQVGACSLPLIRNRALIRHYIRLLQSGTDAGCRTLGRDPCPPKAGACPLGSYYISIISMRLATFFHLPMVLHGGSHIAALLASSSFASYGVPCASFLYWRPVGVIAP